VANGYTNGYTFISIVIVVCGTWAPIESDARFVQFVDVGTNCIKMKALFYATS